MHSTYAIRSNGRIDEIFNDTKLLITGTTNETLLSNSCDLVNTSINAAVRAAGWEYVPSCKSFDEVLTNATNVSLGSPTNFFYSPTANKFFVQNATSYHTDDTVNFTVNTTITSPTAYADNGVVCFAARGATSTGWFTSDGITWTLPTTNVVAGWTCADAVPNGLIIVAGNSWACATSTDNGVTFVSKPALLAALTTGNANGVACGDGKIMVVGSTTLSAISADAGTTFTAKTPPITFNRIKHGNGKFVAIAHGSTTAGVYEDNATGWKTVTLPIAPASGSALEFDETNGVFIYAASTTMLVMSVDGETWIKKQLTSTFAVANIKAKAGVLSTLSATLSIRYELNYASGGFRAPNLLAGTYKYMHLDMGNGGKNRVIMRSFESLEQGQWKNLIYSSDDAALCQRLDLVNGGVLYINASARHCAIFSYLTSGAVWGASTGNAWTSIHEYTRDDLWSDASYPSHLWVNGTFATTYVPRLKTGVGADTTGVSAVLSVVSDSPISKPVLDSSGTGQAQPMRSMRVDSNAFATYAINGGLVLGDVYRTTDSYGTTLQELTLGLNSYVVWATGTTRYLYLKG